MVGDKNYCFRLNEFERNAKISWQEFQMENDFCDITLACEDKHIKTHKLIISSFSPVLRNILLLNQSPHQFIYLEQVRFTVLQNLLNFMYQGQVNVDEEDLSSFFEVAEELDIRGLSEGNTESLYSNGENITSSAKIVKQSDQVKIGNDNYSIKEYEYDMSSEFTENERELVESKFTSDNKQNVTGKQFNCGKCEKQFSSDIFLHNHYKTFHEGVQYPCDKCEFEAMHKTHLKQHVRLVHEGKKHYPCNQCNYKSTKKAHLNQHVMSIHEGERHPCNQCNYNATTKSDINRHIKLIHEVDCYSCDQCNYKATMKSSLKLHRIRLHNAEQNDNIKNVKSKDERNNVQNVGKQFGCGNCEEQFSSAWYLSSHYKSVHKEMKYSCVKCEFRAVQKPHLRKHIRIVHKEERHSCNHCHYISTNKQNLNRHLKSAHKGESY